MNVRKPVDYSAMFAALSTLMAADLPQMALYCGIGRLVSNRSEKGAAVAAAEYLCAAYPDVSGFSPRNLHRMRKFYRAYESVPEVLAQAMTIGRTQNMVIPEVELTLQEQAWYIRAVQQFGWTKLELQLSAPLAHIWKSPSTSQAKQALAANPDAHPLFHSGRGFQYTTRVFHDKLAAAGITQSMSRVGKRIDNGPMEGFWGILKRERYYDRKFTSWEQLSRMIREYIAYCNFSRLQSALCPRACRGARR